VTNQTGEKRREPAGEGVPRLSELPDVLRVDHVAQLMQVSKDAVYDAIRRGQIPAIRVGRKIRVAKSALERLLENGRND
jgi:excisionase family DNA binding protein